MSIELLPPRDKTDTEKLGEVSLDEESPKLAIAKSELEDEDEAVENRLGQERFIWIVVVVVLFDAYIFTQMQNWAGALVIGVIELVAIIVLAKKCRVEEIAGMLTRFLDRVGDLPEKRK